MSLKRNKTKKLQLPIKSYIYIHYIHPINIGKTNTFSFQRKKNLIILIFLDFKKKLLKFIYKEKDVL